MVDLVPQLKADEQYPLLKMEGGSGDGGQPQITTGWRVACTPKRRFFDKWPEFVSACWMTLIIFGISFFVFYALGMTAYRRQPILIYQCNTSKLASGVYYHHLIPRGGYIPFILYADYLGYMASHYSSLQHNVVFLIDDSVQKYSISKHSKFFNKLMSDTTIEAHAKLSDANTLELKKFQRKYRNVNVSIVPLSVFMKMTPLKYRWRTVPPWFVTFYARMFDVWQNGGLAFDLTTFNNIYNSRREVDSRITAILKQHNDGIKPEVYENIFHHQRDNEESDFFNAIFDVLLRMLNDSSNLINKNRTVSSKSNILNTKVIVENDRKLISNINTITTNYNNTKNDSLESTEIKGNLLNDSHVNNTTDTLMPLSKTLPPNVTLPTNETIKSPKKETFVVPKSSNLTDKSIVVDIPRTVFFYDFLLLNDRVGPRYNVFPENDIKSNHYRSSKRQKSKDKSSKSSHFATIDSDGTFVAATSRMHPFLGQILSCGGRKVHPRYFIEDAYISQCSEILGDDEYCANINII